MIELFIAIVLALLGITPAPVAGYVPDAIVTLTEASLVPSEPGPEMRTGGGAGPSWSIAPEIGADEAELETWEGTEGPAGTSGPETLPPCPTEDSDNCIWDAADRGNGTGRSFYVIDDVVTYLEEVS